MADFSINATDVSPIQGGVSVKDPVRVPSTTIPSGGLASSAMSGIGDLAKIGMDYLKEKKEAAQVKSVEDYSQKLLAISDRVDQGQLPSRNAGMEIRALYKQMASSHPSLVGEFSKVTNQFMSTAGLMKHVAEGTEEEKVYNKLKEDALTNGFISRSSIGNRAEEERGIDLFRKWKVEGETLQRAIQEVNLTNAELTRDKNITEKRKSQLELQNLIAQNKIDHALTNGAITFSQKTQSNLDTLEEAFRNRKINADEFLNKTAELRAQAEYFEKAGQGNKTVSGFSALVKSRLQYAEDYAKGKITSEVYTNYNNILEEKEKHTLYAENPKILNSVVLSESFGHAPAVEQLGREAIAESLKGFYQNSRRDTSPWSLTDDVDATKGYLNQVRGGMKAVNSGKAGPKAAEELTDQTYNILKDFSKFEHTKDDPKKLEQVVSALTSSEFGSFMEKHGANANFDDIQEGVINSYKAYNDSLADAVKKYFDESNVVVDFYGTGAAGSDMKTVNAAAGISATFDGARVKFAYTGVKPAGVDPKDIQKKVDALNKNVGPALTRSVQLTAHLNSGKDYKGAWENIVKPQLIDKLQPRDVDQQDKQEVSK